MSMKILIVDDDEFLRDMYGTKFTECGFEVETAVSGESALELLRNSDYDAVLLDIVMPNMSGLDTLEAIRQIPEKGEDIKVIILSNQGEISDLERAEKAKVSGYLVKANFIPSEVVTEVRKILNNEDQSEQ